MLLLDSLIGLIAPHYCVGCNRPGAVLCSVCVRTLPAAERRCYRCLRPNLTFATCLPCGSDAPLSAVYAATRYTGAGKDALWRLKFERSEAAARIIARRMYTTLPKLPNNILIVPLPTARARVRQRGYDQAVLIAREYARLTGRSYTSLLVRHGSQEQIGAGREQRRAQLDGAFSIRPGVDVRGKTVLLIDDVVTTGATFDAAARVVLGNGARTVHALAFAQA